MTAPVSMATDYLPLASLGPVSSTVSSTTNDRYRGSENGPPEPTTPYHHTAEPQTTPLCPDPQRHSPDPTTPNPPLRLRGGHDPTYHPSVGRLTLGALNIKGANSPATQYKWDLITNKMKTENIAILCLSETHVDTPLAAFLDSRYPFFMLLHSFDPNHTRAGGVSIIINTHIIKLPPTDVAAPIPGRALSLTLEWPSNSPIKILAIYAPNISSTGHENENFWQTLDQATQNYQIDVLLGDFNVTEEAADRLPPREDARPAIAALQTLTANLQLTDRWRRTNPHPIKRYTFGHNTGSYMSRIDRIYASERILQKAFKWDICLPGLPTADHQLVLMEMHDETAPSIGRGRWTTPPFLIDDKEFLKR